jgi:hypothetical protein
LLEKLLATLSGSFTFSFFVRRDGMCSGECIFPVSCLTVFHVVFILSSDLATSPHYIIQDFTVLNVKCSFVWIIAVPALDI